MRTTAAVRLRGTLRARLVLVAIISLMVGAVASGAGPCRAAGGLPDLAGRR